MEVCVTLAALQSPPLPSTDAARLRALAEYAILDTDHEDSFDQLAVLAARLVEQMEDAGLVSASNHVGKREILVPEQQ